MDYGIENKELSTYVCCDRIVHRARKGPRERKKERENRETERRIKQRTEELFCGNLMSLWSDLPLPK